MAKYPDAAIMAEIAELARKDAEQALEAEVLEEFLEKKFPDGKCLKITIKSERDTAGIPVDGATLRGYFAETLVGNARNMLRSGANEDLGKAIRLIPWYLIPKDLREHQDAKDETAEREQQEQDQKEDNISDGP